jgi:hypothetical protein
MSWSSYFYKEIKVSSRQNILWKLLETPYDGLVPDGVYLFSSGNDEIESAVVGVADDDLA